MFKLTIVAGVLALFAVAAPDIVMLGLFLIVPGLILILAPTTFIYLAAATAIRSLIPQPAGLGTTFFSLLVAGVLGWSITLPFQAMEQREFHAAVIEDVPAATPVKLQGHVRLERGDIVHWKATQKRECDHLCAALLLTPGVKSVTLAKGKQLEEETNWRLAPLGSVADTGQQPSDPEDIFSHYPVESKQDLGGRSFFDVNKARRHALAAEWNLRLATKETLVASDVIPEPDMTIAISKSREKSKPKVQRVEVLNRKGVTLFRRSLVQHRVVQAPFYIEFQASFGGSKFAVGRSLLSTGARNERFDAVTELLQNVVGLRQTPSETASRKVKPMLVAALKTTTGRPSELDLAGPWIEGLQAREITDEDAAIVGQIIGDLRIQNVGQAVRHLYPQKAPVECRAALVQRILARETDSKDRNHFAKLLSKMPAGTFADLNEQEWQIILDPGLSSETEPFIERLADLGKPGAQHLANILQNTVDTVPEWHLRRGKMRAISRGFARLGTDGATALPLVKSLFEQEPRSPIRNDASEALQWRVAMARMGLPINELPYPPSWSDRSITKMREKVARRLADFDPDE